MTSLPSFLPLLPAVGIVVLAGLSFARSTQSRHSRLPQWITAFVGGQCLFSVVAAIAVATGSLTGVFGFSAATDSAAAGWWQDLITLNLDATGGLMLALVSFVGWVVCQYSLRYLDGDQGRTAYFRWIGLTVAAVCLLAIAGSVLLFALAWFGTSIGIHQLLLHQNRYGGPRPAAVRAAWTKFAISRLGDAAIALGIGLVYWNLGSTRFETLNTAAASAIDLSSSLVAGIVLLTLAAIIKTAQFPFHTWLPQTMETPTPVSALMHAGIVNAGGFLMIRMASTVVEVPAAMLMLGIIGAITTCFGALVMMTQPTIKTGLAYSTIAQMGFMMLQCGLGAFSAAMLHLLAHSLYKAYSFLSSGSVLDERLTMQVKKRRDQQLSARGSASSFGTLNLWGRAATTLLVVGAALAGSLWLVGIDLIEKPGGLVLGGVIWFSLSLWLFDAWDSVWKVSPMRSVVTVGGLCLAYAVALAAVMGLVGDDPLYQGTIPVQAILGCVVGLGFVLLALTHLRASAPSRRDWIDRVRVHAAAGFYVDALTRRMFSFK